MRPQERSKDAPADGTAAVIPEFIDPDEAVVSGWFADYTSTSDDGGGDAMSWLAAVASRPHRSERLGVGASPPAKEECAKEMQPLGKAARKAISRRLRREQEEAEYAAKGRCESAVPLLSSVTLARQDANAVHAAPEPFAAMLEQDVDITLKVIVVGNGQVGKTSMITRFAKGIFTNEYKKTIGVDFLEKRTFLKDVGEEVTYLLWDTAGQEEYDAITRAYYKGAGACILAFSTTDRDSFDAIESWYKKVHDECGNLVMVLVQNKVDLLDEAVVEAKEVETLAKKLRLKLYRTRSECLQLPAKSILESTCVKDDLNVSEVFTHLGNEFVKNGGEASVGRAGMMSIEEVASKPMAERSAAAKAGGAAPAEDAAGDQPFKLSNGKPSVQRTGGKKKSRESFSPFAPRLFCVEEPSQFLECTCNARIQALAVRGRGRLALEKFGGVKGANSVEPPEEKGRSSSAAPRPAAASRGAVGSRGALMMSFGSHWRDRADVMAMTTSVEKLQLLGSSAITRRYLQLRFGLISGEDGGGQEEASKPLKRKQEHMGLPDLPTRKKLWQAQGMHAVDVDLQAVIVDQKGVIIDAAYYNNMKALRCVTHSGDEQTGEKTGMDETVWVMLPRVPAQASASRASIWPVLASFGQVRLIIFVVAAHNRGQLKDVSNGVLHVLEDDPGNEVASYRMEQSAKEVDAVFVMVRSDSGDWSLRVLDEPAQQGRHFMDILEPTLGNLIRAEIPAAPKRQKVAFAMEKGSMVELPQTSDLGKVTAGLGWDVKAGPGPDVDLDVSVVFFAADGQHLGAVFFGNQEEFGVVHSGDNLTGEGSGDDEVITVNLSAIPDSVTQMVFSVNIYTPNITFDRDGTELARYVLREARGETGLLIARLMREPGPSRWGFQAIGTFCKGRTWKDSLRDMDPLVRSTARQVQMITMRSTADVGLSAAAGSRDNPIRATVAAQPADQKKDCSVPHLYDLVVAHRRSSDIRSFSWPSGAARISKNAVLQRIVLGSSKALMLAAVRLPWPERLAEESKHRQPWEEQKEADEAVQPFVRITQYMAHDGLSTLACSPQEYLLTATQKTSGEVLVFRAADWEVAYQDECRPELRLSGEGGASGLAWTDSSSQLLAVNRGGVTCWNIQTGDETARFAAGREVTALAASSFGNTFIVGCSEGRLAWWDTRVQGLAPTCSCDTRHGPVQCAAFADVELGSADGHVQAWDARQLGAPLCDLRWPGSACGGVGHVAWAPSGNCMLANDDLAGALATPCAVQADDDRRTWDVSYLISPLAPGAAHLLWRCTFLVRRSLQWPRFEMQLDSELVSILCHRSRRRLRDLQYTCKVTMRLDRNRHVLSLTGADAGIEMAKQQIEGLSGPRRQVPLKVWVELMRTRTLSLDDLAEPKIVSVAWVQECSGCRLHIERSSCEVRIFGSQSGAAIASKIIDEPGLATSTSLGSHSGHKVDETETVDVEMWRSHSDCLAGLGIAVLGLEANVARAISQLELFLDDPQGYGLPDAGKQLPPVQEARPKAPATSLPKVDAEPKRADNVCPTCGSGPYCSNCGQLVWRHGYTPNQGTCVSPARQYQFVVMQPMEAAGNMNCMMPNMQPMQPMQTMQPMQPMQSMQSPMMPMCMPMAVAVPLTTGCSLAIQACCSEPDGSCLRKQAAPRLSGWQRPTEMVGWCCGTQSSARKRHGKPVGASPLKRSLFMELIPDRTSVVSLGVETVHGCSPRPRGRISSFGARLRRFLLRPRHWEPEVSLGVLRKVSH
eukprot:s2205_g8.t3